MTRSVSPVSKVLAAFALLMAMAAANSACVFFTYQEELPESAGKLRKF